MTVEPTRGPTGKDFGSVLSFVVKNAARFRKKTPNILVFERTKRKLRKSEANSADGGSVNS